MNNLEEKQIEFNKRFAFGEQYIILENDIIFEQEKHYYWEERAVYNHILPLINHIQNKCKQLNLNLEESDLYGNFGLVSQLIPIQRAYNKIKNYKMNLFENLSSPPLMVEDGSVDTDSLEEDGLNSGRVLVYRQGSKTPYKIEPTNFYNELDKEESRLIREFNFITENFLETLKIKK